MKSKTNKASAAPKTRPSLLADQISIDRFRLVKGNILSDPEFDTSLIRGYSIETQFEMGFILKKNKVRSIFQVTIKTDSEQNQKKEAEGMFELYYYFTVENLKALANQDSKGLIKVHADLANAIASVTYSTTRGMLMARLQSTALQDFILPVVNPNEVAKSGFKTKQNN